MRRALLILAFISAAGSVGAQMPAPASGTTSPDTRMNTLMNSGNGSDGSRGADTASAPAGMTGAAATAQKQIEREGYKDVQGLSKGADGLWHGTAKRGERSVEVTVDRAGRVAAQ
jgi:hypothetical protein